MPSRLPSEIWYAARPSFRYPVPRPVATSEPDAVVCIPRSWMPYVLGAMQQLEQPTTWQGTEDEIKVTQGEAAQLIIDMASASCGSRGTEPYWDDDDAGDADDTTPTPTTEPWYNNVGDFVLTAFLAVAFEPQSAITFITTVRKIRVWLRTRNYGAIVKLLADETEVAEVDTYSETPGLVEYTIDNPSAASVKLQVVHSGLFNPSATPQAKGYAMEVVRKRLSTSLQDFSTMNFRFTEECGLEYSPDGSNWTPVSGWAEFAPTCFKGDPGADGADGTNGVDGADGCSPVVTIEYPPEGSHKILTITPCEGEPTTLDLTQEIVSVVNTGAGDSLRCRFARSIAPEMATLIVEALSGALPIWDLGVEGVSAAIVNEFMGAGLTSLQTTVLVATVETLYAEGYDRAAAASGMLQDSDYVRQVMSYIYSSFTVAEISVGEMNGFFALLNDGPTAGSEWVIRLYYALWVDNQRLVETWSWNAMAHPDTDGGCDTFEPPPPEQWEHYLGFDAWNVTYGTDGGGGAVDSEYETNASRIDITVSIPEANITYLEYGFQSNSGTGGAQLYYVNSQDDVIAPFDLQATFGSQSELAYRHLDAGAGIHMKGLRFTFSGFLGNEFVSHLNYVLVRGTGVDPFNL